MSFSLSGGVEVVGFISPTDPLDTYPVIDPLYGIDGLRNVDTLTDLNNIPNLRRRAGMLVGINNGSQFYKLNTSPWTGTITDWTLVNFGIDTFVTGTTFSPNQAIAICAMGKRLAVPLKCVRGKQLAVPLRRVRGKSAVKVVTEVVFQDCA